MMRLFGYEIRRIPPEEPFDIDVSHSITFDPGNAHIRIRPKPGYRLCEPGEGGVDKIWVDIEGDKLLGVLKDTHLT
jgi:hypothetical protein